MQVEWLECNQIAPDVIDTVKRERVVGYELSVCPGAASVHPAASITREERVPAPAPPPAALRPPARTRSPRQGTGAGPATALHDPRRPGPCVAPPRRAQARARACAEVRLRAARPAAHVPGGDDGDAYYIIIITACSYQQTQDQKAKGYFCGINSAPLSFGFDCIETHYLY